MKNSFSQQGIKNLRSLKSSYRIKKYFSKGECPICGGAKSSCRETEDGWVLCRSGHEGYGYELVRTNTLGFSEYILQEDADNYTEERAKQQKENWEKSEKERIAAYKTSLDEADRHEEIQKILDCLTLSKKHKKLLQKRGFSRSEMEVLGYRTIEKFQKLSVPVNPHLAGVNSIGKGLTYAGEEGILCPIRNLSGKWVGFKINNPNAKKEEGQAKYVWAVSKSNKNREKAATSHLQNGEMPISCQVGGLNGIGFSEGPEYKSALIALRREEVVIGCSTGKAEIEQTTQYLKKWKGERIFTVWADAGSAINTNVLSQYKKVARLAKSEGFKVQVAWYGQRTKELPDPDEYFGTFFFVPFEEWISRFSIFAKKKRNSSKKIVNPNIWQQPNKSIKKIVPSTLKGKYFYSLEFTPNGESNKGQYLDFRFLLKHQNIAIRSPMGTGKTEALVKTTEHFKRAGLVTLLIGARNSCLVQTCRRLGMDHLLLDGDAGSLVNIKSGEGFGHCADSLFRWEDSNKRPDVVIIDEVSSTLPHLLKGETCKKLRRKLLEQLCLNLKNAKRVILMDALLKDWEVKYIEKISGKKFFKLEKKVTETPLKILNYIGTTGEKLNSPITAPHGKLKIGNEKKYRSNSPHFFRQAFLLASREGPFVFFSDSIKEIANVIGIKYGKEYLNFEFALSSGVLRIDSETSSYPQVVKFLSDPDKFIDEMGIVSIFCSPSVESGLSITKMGYFENLFFYNCHLGNESIMQMLLRVRDRKCLRHIYCKAFTNLTSREREIKIDNQGGFTNSIQQIVTDHAESFLDTPLESINLEKTKKEMASEIANSLKNTDQDTLSHVGAIEKIEKQLTFEKANLRETVMDRLKNEGAKITDILGNSKTFNVKEIQEANSLRRAKNLFDAPDTLIRNGREVKIDIETAEAISREYIASPEEKLVAAKYLLKEKTLPGIEDTTYWNPEFISEFKFSNSVVRTQIYMRCILDNLPTFEKIGFMDVDRQLDMDSLVLATDIQTPVLKVKAAQKAGIIDLIETIKIGKEFGANSEYLRKLANKFSHKTRSIYFGKRGGGDVIKYLNTILKSFGYSLKSSSKRKGGKSNRTYRLVDLLNKHEYTETVYSILKNKYEKIANEKEKQHNEILTTKKEVKTVAERLKKKELIL